MNPTSPRRTKHPSIWHVSSATSFASLWPSICFICCISPVPKQQNLLLSFFVLALSSALVLSLPNPIPCRLSFSLSRFFSGSCSLCWMRKKAWEREREDTEKQWLDGAKTLRGVTSLLASLRRPISCSICLNYSLNPRVAGDFRRGPSKGGDLGGVRRDLSFVLVSGVLPRQSIFFVGLVLVLWVLNVRRKVHRRSRPRLQALRPLFRSRPAANRTRSPSGPWKENSLLKRYLSLALAVSCNFLDGVKFLDVLTPGFCDCPCILN